MGFKLEERRVQAIQREYDSLFPQVDLQLGVGEVSEDNDSVDSVVK